MEILDTDSEFEKTIRKIKDVKDEKELLEITGLSLWSSEGWWAAVVFEMMKRRGNL